MDSGTSAAIKIEPGDLMQFKDIALSMLGKVTWTPHKATSIGPPKTKSEMSWIETPDRRVAEEMSLLKSGQRISGSQVLMNDDVNYVINTIHKALQIGLHISTLYGVSSGLERLIQGNRRGTLSSSEQTEFRSKFGTAAAVCMFTSANYVIWKLSRYKAEETGNINLEFQGIPEFCFENQSRSLECMLFYYSCYLEKSGTVNLGIEMLKMTLLYFRAVLDEIKLRQESFAYPEFFTNQTYKLTWEDFAINGFEIASDGSQISVEFNRVDINTIVGNKEAKHLSRRTSGALMCYDFEKKRNPMQELGGLTPVKMGFGPPGTGKSMQIAADGTKIKDVCDWLKVPFVFHPAPDSLVSKFQGESAEKMHTWMKLLSDPTKIIFAPIDDGENILEERSRQGVSAGVREVIGVFLRMTEGAYAVNHGNSVIVVYTNLPDQIDSAVLSRIVERAHIGGAETWFDFLDQDYLWWKKYVEIDPDFVNMKNPDNYQYLANQALLKTLSESGNLIKEPREERIKDLWQKALQEHNPDEHMFFARLYELVKGRFPNFTSRDVRNIQRAVDKRILDFDFPDEWYQDRDLFFGCDYDTKLGMLKEQMRHSMGKLSMAEVRMQEAARYLDAMVEITDVGRERLIKQRMEEIDIAQTASKRFSLSSN